MQLDVEQIFEGAFFLYFTCLMYSTLGFKTILFLGSIGEMSLWSANWELGLCWTKTPFFILGLEAFLVDFLVRDFDLVWFKGPCLDLPFSKNIGVFKSGLCPLYIIRIGLF